MPIDTPLTALSGHRASDPVGADGHDRGRRLVTAVSEAGGFGIFGGGYGDKAWLEQETAKLKSASSAVRHRLHHLEPGEAT